MDKTLAKALIHEAYVQQSIQQHVSIQPQRHSK